jgi:hypothetical protein
MALRRGRHTGAKAYEAIRREFDGTGPADTTPAHGVPMSAEARAAYETFKYQRAAELARAARIIGDQMRSEGEDERTNHRLETK